MMSVRTRTSTKQNPTTTLTSGPGGSQTSLDLLVFLVQGHPDLRVTAMTQEIGYVASSQGDIDYEKYPIGSTLVLLPFHSCATAACYMVRIDSLNSELVYCNTILKSLY